MDMIFVFFLSSEGCWAVSCGSNHKSVPLQLPLLFSEDSHQGKKNSIQPSVPCNMFCDCQAALCLEGQDVPVVQPQCLFLCTTKWLLNDDAGLALHRWLEVRALYVLYLLFRASGPPESAVKSSTSFFLSFEQGQQHQKKRLCECWQLPKELALF